MSQILFSNEKLYKRCIVSAIAHVVFTFNNPFFAYSQSWGGNNSSFHYGSARRTISFSKDHTQMAVAIRNENSSRIAKYPQMNALQLFRNAPAAVQEPADEEALQYLFDDLGDGREGPLATAAFWSEDSQVVFPDDSDVFWQHGCEFPMLLMQKDDEFLEWVQSLLEDGIRDRQVFEYLCQEYEKENRKVSLPIRFRYLKKQRDLQKAVNPWRKSGCIWEVCFED